MRKRRLARALWALALGGTVLYLAAAVFLWVAFGDHPNVRSLLAPWVLMFLFAGTATATLGYLIVTRRSERKIGYLLLAIGLVHVMANLADVYGSLSFQLLDRPLPLARYLVFLPWSLRSAVSHLLVLVFLLFPDDRLPSRWWRPVAALVVAQGALNFIGSAFGAVPYYFTFGEWLTVPKFQLLSDAVAGELYKLDELMWSWDLWIEPLGLIALLSRFGGVDAVRRRQIAWVFLGGLLTYVFLRFPVGIGDLLGFTPDPPDCEQCIPWVFSIGNVFFPAFTLVAVLRHGLWQTSVVLNKALVYGSVAGFIAAVYVAVVVGLGSVVGTAGELNIWLSILATGIVAIGFQDVRERAQRLANRLIYGERATPYEALAELSRRMNQAISLNEVLPGMAEAAARGLGAPSATVRLLVPGRGDRVATWPVGMADGQPDLTVPVEHQGELLGEISVTRGRGESITGLHRRLLQDLASQAGLAMRNVRLTEELQDRLLDIQAHAAEVRASRARIVAAGDAERKRVERNLHDGAQQRLITLGLQLRMLKDALGDGGSQAQNLLARAETEAEVALDELRELGQGVHPSVLTDEGLGPAVEYLAERAPVPVALDVSTGRLPEPIEATAYYVVAEALANVVKYARASRVTVQISRREGEVLVEVTDDGVGGADPGVGTGLRGLADRIAVLDGRLTVDSPEGRGTRIEAGLPCG